MAPFSTPDLTRAAASWSIVLRYRVSFVVPVRDYRVPGTNSQDWSAGPTAGPIWSAENRRRSAWDRTVRDCRRAHQACTSQHPPSHVTAHEERA